VLRLAAWLLSIPAAIGMPQSAVDADLRAGLLALDRNDLVHACEFLERAVKQDPRSAVGWVALAQSYLRSGRRDGAMAAASNAEQFGADTPAIEHALALFYAGTGDPARAAGWELRLAAQAAPPQEAFVYDLGQALLQREDFEPALAVLDMGRRQFPENASIAVAFGVACYGRRRFEDAVTAFLDAVRLDASIEQPYVFLGRILDHAGERLPRVIRAFAAWEKKDPDNYLPVFLHAKALAAASGPPSPQIEAELLRSIHLNDSFWESHLELGVLLAQRADWQAAAGQLSRSIELNPRSIRAHYQLARVYQRQGNLELARKERAEYERLNEAANPLGERP
jgi:tetratricopeptide (TPR) repeat protein